MRKTIVHIFLLLVLSALPGLSQVNSFSDQYLSNLLLLNPAWAGTGKYGVLSACSRQQWSGWDGAPASQSVTFSTRWSRSKARFTPLGFVNKGKNTFSNVGIGGGFFHDSYGVFHLTGIHLDYAYHLFLRNGRLSFGLAPSIFQIGSSSVLLADPNDPYLDNPNKSYFVDFNAGMHYSNQNAYAGLSMVQLFNSSVKFGNYGFPGKEDPTLNPDLSRSVYAYGGYFFMLNKSINLKLEPMVVLKYNGVDGFRYDLSTTVHLRDMFQAGLSYQRQDDLSFFVGVRLDNLSFRYLFEVPVATDLSSQISHYISHNIQVAINIGQPID